MLPLGFGTVSHQTSVVVPSLDCACQTETKRLSCGTVHMGTVHNTWVKSSGIAVQRENLFCLCCLI